MNNHSASVLENWNLSKEALEQQQNPFNSRVSRTTPVEPISEKHSLFHTVLVAVMQHL